MIILMLFISGCSDTNEESNNQENENNNQENENNNQENEDNKEENENGGNEDMNEPVIIVITLEDDRQIKVELYPDVAPITVANFLKLVDQKFFDGVCFHRVIPGFMIQTGGYYLDGYTLNEKEEVPSIKGEFASNGVENDLKHTLGVISMARTGVKDSASSQFFICSADAPHLDGEYAAFGKVIDEESLKVVLEVSAVPTMNIGYGFSDFPQFPVVIKTIRRGE